jgi:hypothetical protein
MLRTSVELSQLHGGCSREACARAEAEQRTPEAAVDVQDEPGICVRCAVRLLKNLLNIGGEVQRLGEHDEIEGPAKRQFFARHDVKLAARDAEPRRGDLVRGDVYADDILIRQQLEQMAGAASYFEDARVCRDEIAVVRGEELAVNCPAFVGLVGAES